MNSDLVIKSASLAIEQTREAQNIEKTIQLIEKSLKENSSIIDEFETNTPTVKSVISENKQKDEIIKKKREELLQLQNALIKIKTLRKKDDKDTLESWEPVPIVVNRIQDLVMKLSETAINDKTVAIPILSIFKVNDALNTLFDISSSEGFINETEEEKQKRLEDYANKQKHILEILKKYVNEDEGAEA